MKPILFELPVPIETPRLLLCPPKPGDGKALNEAIQESFPELNMWTPWARERPSIEDSECMCRQFAAKWILREQLTLWIWDKTSNKFLGGTGFHSIQWDVPCLEIGYWLRTSWTKKGIMTEAVNALTRYAFEVIKAKRVEIRCDPNNKSSYSVANRLGYRLDARLEQSFALTENQIRDTNIYSRLNTKALPNLEVKW